MITREEFLQALEIVNKYKLQLYSDLKKERNLLLNAKRGDYVTYIGGSNSKYFIIGNKYRLPTDFLNTRESKIVLINEKGTRVHSNSKCFRFWVSNVFIYIGEQTLKKDT